MKPSATPATRRSVLQSALVDVLFAAGHDSTAEIHFQKGMAGALARGRWRQ